jgi:chromosome segregation ATPase
MKAASDRCDELRNESGRIAFQIQTLQRDYARLQNQILTLQQRLLRTMKGGVAESTTQANINAAQQRMFQLGQQAVPLTARLKELESSIWTAQQEFETVQERWNGLTLE